MEYLKRSVIRKIIFVSIISIIISMSVLTYIIVCNTFDAMKESNEQTIKKEISLLVENIQTFNNVAKTGADRMGNIFMDMIGKVEVLNNEEINVKGLNTPVILANNQIANLNFSLVDKFTKTTEGSVATIFVRKGQDFIRVTTSLKKENGQRAIGTKLNINHPSYKKAIKGEEYLGKAVLFGKSYMTKYIPIKDKSNNVIAIAFIGSDITTDLKQLTNTIGNKKIGKTGYYYILNSKEGKNYGKFLFHPKLNNSFGIDFKDSKGNYFIKNMLKAKNGVLEYLWKGNKKFVVYETFDEWNWLLVGGVDSHEILEKANEIMYITIALSILTLIFISLSIFITLRISLRSLNKIKNGLLEFFNYLNRKTDNIEKISVNTIDEFGVMAKVINENIEKTQKNLEDDRKLIDETISVLGEFEQGDLCQRLNSSVENPALLELKTVLNKMADNLEKNIDNVLNILEEYSNYKYLNKISKKDLKEHLLKLANGVNHLGDSITLMLVENKSNGLTLDESSNILLENVDKLNNSSTEAASSLEETAATLEQITSNIRSNTENIAKMSNFSNEVIKSATHGESLANETTNAMDEINEQVVSINEAITVIDQIAFQTNILSLNAAVEAATAGDAGKGFAVVAQEVRNLASRSAEAAKEIKNLVETATLKANSGKEIATDMINGYKQLNENISYSTGLIQDIENASKEQLQGIEQINDAVNQLDQQTQQNAMVASQTHDVAVLTDEIAKLVVSKADEKEFEGKNEAKALEIKKSTKLKSNQTSKVNSKKPNDNKWEKF